MNETFVDGTQDIPTHEQLAARQLRLLRQGRGWSQLEVAEKMRAYGYQWSQATVTRLEAASRPIRLNELADLAVLYGVPVTQFLESEVPDDLEAIDSEIAHLTDDLGVVQTRLDEAAIAFAEAAEQHSVLAVHSARIEGRLEMLMRWRPGTAGGGK